MRCWFFALMIALSCTVSASLPARQTPALEPGLQARIALAQSMEQLPQAGQGAWKDWDEEAGIDERVQAQYLEALKAWRQEDYPAVVLALVPALKTVPDYPACLHLLGHAQFRMRRHEQCVLLLQRLLRVAPQLVGRTRHLGHSLGQLGRTAEALAHYDLVLAAEPGDLQARRGRAVAHWRAGHAERALADLSKVVQSDPEQGQAWLLRATIWYDMEELEKARVAVGRARNLRPRDPEPAFLLARILLELGEKEKARTMEQIFKTLELERSVLRPLEGQLLIDPWNLDLLTRLVRAHQRSGDRPAARGVLSRLGRAAKRVGNKQVLAWVAEQQEQSPFR